ncbi:HSP90 family protein [Listeria costaricensis]|uniref:HSP90 family protein n=1 Tax=Listeria costaricensis TaxID=2026604 RepID=UPI0023E1422B|nr:HSP90 family protein [Listeria costaricensis]
MSQDYRFQVNLGGMIDILSNHIYNSKDVYIRELLQNATDAVRARKKIEPDYQGNIHVSLTGSGENTTLIFEDNGIGLTNSEVHAFLATIANSSKGSKSFDIDENDFIGRFGIGLLSCFIASPEIVLITTSARNHETTEWRGKADGTYQVRTLDTAGREPGTQLFLRAKTDLILDGSCFEADILKETLIKYGAMLEVPIIFDDDQVLNEETQIYANKAALQNCSSEEILQLGRELLHQDFTDYFYIENNTGETFGIAYILPYAVQMTAKQHHTVYLNRMFVTATNDNLLPTWAFFTRTLLFTNELQPVASREDFYKNDILKQTATSLGAALKNGLVNLEPKKLDKLIATHYVAFKSVATEDEEFLRFIYPFLPFRTLDGEEKLKDITERSSTIYFTHSVDDFRQVRDLARNRGFELINGGYTFDTKLLTMLMDMIPGVKLEMAEPDRFAGDLESLDRETDAEHATLLTYLNQEMRQYDVEIALRKFEPEDLPMLFINPSSTQFYREMERSAEESNPLFGSIIDSIRQNVELPPQSTLYLNFQNPVIQKLFTQKRSPEKMLIIVESLYIQALLLGHYPLKQKERTLMNQNYLQLLDQIGNVAE